MVTMEMLRASGPGKSRCASSDLTSVGVADMTVHLSWARALTVESTSKRPEGKTTASPFLHARSALLMPKMWLTGVCISQRSTWLGS